MLRIRTDSPLRHRPWANWFIILASIGAYALQRHDPTLMPRFQLDLRSGSLLPFLTYAFLHISILHLLSNVLVLLLLGGHVNERLGHIGHLAFFFGAAVFSGVGFLAMRSSAVVGSSGAVGAVMAAYVVLLPRSNIQVMMHVGRVQVRALHFVLIFFAYNLLMTLAGVVTGQSVAYEAHVAGMLFGFVLTLALQAARLLPRQSGDLLSVLLRWRRGHAPHDRPAEPRPGDAPQSMEVTMLRARCSDAAAQRDLPAAAALYRQLHALDPQQCLPRQAQLDIASQLASEQRFPDAAVAYELFLRHYPAFEQANEVELMLGLVYARYLDRPDRAIALLRRALETLPPGKQADLAQRELDRLERHLPA